MALAASQKVTSIEVAGFKSAADPVRINVRGITILAGANSSGKSTIMQPLLLLKQTIEKPFDPGGLAIDGPLVRFTHANQFFSHTSRKDNEPRFTIRIEHGSSSVKLSYGRSESLGVDIQEMAFGAGDDIHTWKNGESLSWDAPSLNTGSDEFNVRNYPKEFKKRFPKLTITRDRACLTASVTFDGHSRASLLISPGTSATRLARDMIYLPGLRGNPERQYVVSAVGPQFPGNFNDYIASIIHEWGTNKNQKIKTLGTHLKRLGLTWQVSTRALDDTRVEVHVGRLPAAVRGGARDTVNIADVGFGVSQTLPVLVALLAASPGHLVFIEQPELHLHPRAQVSFADIIVEAALRGVQVICETHSSLLILALQAAIASGRITPDQVSFNWFTRDTEGRTHIDQADIKANGSYGSWPVDFDEIELNLQNDYMTSVDERHND